MTTINDFSQRLNMDFGLMPTAIGQRRADLEREYHERQERFQKSFVPALAQLRLRDVSSRNSTAVAAARLLSLKLGARLAIGRVDK